MYCLDTLHTQLDNLKSEQILVSFCPDDIKESNYVKYISIYLQQPLDVSHQNYSSGRVMHSIQLGPGRHTIGLRIPSIIKS